VILYVLLFFPPYVPSLFLSTWTLIFPFLPFWFPCFLDWNTCQYSCSTFYPNPCFFGSDSVPTSSELPLDAGLPSLEPTVFLPLPTLTASAVPVVNQPTPLAHNAHDLLLPQLSQCLINKFFEIGLNPCLLCSILALIGHTI